jgi:ribosomal-protein-alanine N-acetyltransferase
VTARPPAATAWRIEPAGWEHAGVLAALHRDCFTPGWDRAAFAALLTGPGVAATLVSEARDAAQPPVGLLLVRRAADEAEILTLGVVPAARRRGAAEALLSAAIEGLTTSGAATLWLEVAASNTGALALYSGLRFEAVGRRPGYYAKPDGGAEDALVLRRVLAPAPG